MGQLLLVMAGALTVAAVIFGVVVLVTGNDPGLAPAEPDGRAVPLPANRPLREEDVVHVRFDIALRGYRMDQVDQAMSRAAYDIGYKDELIGVLEAEVTALREGRTADADALRDAREAAASAREADAPGHTDEPSADAPERGEPPAPTAPAAGPVTGADETSAARPASDDAADRRSVTDADASEVDVRDLTAADPFTRPTVELPGRRVRSERT